MFSIFFLLFMSLSLTFRCTTPFLCFQNRNNNKIYSRAAAMNGSDKPVSSYASLASGPPPSYARQGSSNSWDDGDKMHRPPSPRPKGPSYYPPSRGGGGGGRGGGRYDGNRLGGGRGRSFRGGGGGGGRERNERYDRGGNGDSTMGNHHSSPDRFIPGPERHGGYESGEISSMQRSVAGGNHRRDERHMYDSRGPRPGGFVPRGGGGGRDPGRGGGGGRLQRGGGRGGRYFDRGGRGGRSDYRGRGRMGEGRDLPGGRPAPDGPHRFSGGDVPEPDDGSGPRFGGGDMHGRSEMNFPRNDDRSPKIDRMGPTSPRDLGPRNQVRYSSMIADSDQTANRNIDNRGDDRFVKRRRDGVPFNPSPHDDKRTRVGEFAPRNRPPMNSDNRTASVSPHMSSDGPTRQLRNPTDARGNDLKGRIVDGPGPGAPPPPPPPSSGNSNDDFPPSHDDGRMRNGLDCAGNREGVPHHGDPRARHGPSGMQDDLRDRDYHRNEKRLSLQTPANDPRLSREPFTIDREDQRERLMLKKSQREPIGHHREDLRPIPPTYRDDNPINAQRNHPRHFQYDNNPKEFRQMLDGRPNPPDADNHIRNFSRSFDVNDDRRGLSRPVGDKGSDIGSSPRGPGPSDGPADRMVGKAEDPRDYRSKMSHSNVQRREEPRKTAGGDYHPENDGWHGHTQQPSTQPFSKSSQPPQSRNTWNSMPRNRLSLQPPNQGRRPDGQHDLGGLDNRPSFPDHDSWGHGRGGRGRGGFRGRGRGRSDFGRFAGMGGRMDNEHSRNSGQPWSGGPDSQHGHHRDGDGGWNRGPNDGPRGNDSSGPGGSSFSSQQQQTHQHQQKPSTDERMSDNENSQNRSQKSHSDTKGHTSGDAGSTGKTQPAAAKAEENEIVIVPPPAGKPSGVMQALARFVELEAQMEYAFAKHMRLVNERSKLQAQVKVLSQLPVGLEALKEELAVVPLEDTTKEEVKMES